MRTIHAASVLVFAASASAATFKVVAPGATDSVQVSVNGEKVDLHADDPQVPYYTGQASCSGTCKYKVIALQPHVVMLIYLYNETSISSMEMRKTLIAHWKPKRPKMTSTSDK